MNQEIERGWMSMCAEEQNGQDMKKKCVCVPAGVCVCDTVCEGPCE